MKKNNKQGEIWDKIYSKKNLMTGDKPQISFMHFVKFLKKEWKKQGKANEYGESALKGKTFLDLGSGEGKNSIFLAKAGVKVSAVEISKVACRNFLLKLKRNNNLIEREIEYSEGKIDLKNGSISSEYEKNFNFSENYFDVVLDITVSNALNKLERKKYLKEVNKVLKKDGYFFVRVPAKDDNARNMIKNFSAFKITEEKNSYIIPDLGITETVFTEETFKEKYEKYFKIIKLEKEKHYTKTNGKVYKRFFIIAYMVKK